jgi:hypothetical protein
MRKLANQQAPLPPRKSQGVTLAANDLAMAEALLRHWDETDTRHDWLDGLVKNPARLAQMHKQTRALGLATVLPPDTRCTCRQCRNLARNGRCLAAGRGELSLTSSQYEPFQDRLERCGGYLPTADEPDQRPGNERYPGPVSTVMGHRLGIPAANRR